MNHVYRCLDRLTDVILFQSDNEVNVPILHKVQIQVVTCPLLTDEYDDLPDGELPDFAVFITFQKRNEGIEHLYFRPISGRIYSFDDFKSKQEFVIKEEFLAAGVRETFVGGGSNLIKLDGVGYFSPYHESPFPDVIYEESGRFVINRKALDESTIKEFENRTARRWKFNMYR